MNKTLTVLLIVGAACLGTGIIVTGIAAASVGFDFTRLSTSGSYTYQDYESSKSFLSVTVSEENAAIDVYPSTDGQFKITYGENKREKYTFVETDTTLTVTADYDYRWYDMFNWSFEQKVLSVYVPLTFDGTLSLTTSNGSLSAQNCFAGSLSLASSNGSITVDDVIVDGAASFSSSNGSIAVDGVSASGVVLSDSNGWQTIENITATDSLSVTNSNGSIYVSSIDVNDSITLITSAGSISGGVKGPSSDYSISSHTSLGQSNLPSSSVATTGSKTLNAETSLGSISISFVS
jgi:hypothetical protein